MDYLHVRIAPAVGPVSRSLFLDEGVGETKRLETGSCLRDLAGLMIGPYDHAEQVGLRTRRQQRGKILLAKSLHEVVGVGAAKRGDLQISRSRLRGRDVRLACRLNRN